MSSSDHQAQVGRVDCHAHVIDPKRFVYADGPGYRPLDHETGDLPAFTQVLDWHQITHSLLVQPSCYGRDNSAMLDAIGRSNGRFKGIAVVDPAASTAEWQFFKQAGIVGVRLNLLYGDPAVVLEPSMRRFFDRVRDLDWFLEICAPRQNWPAIIPALRTSGLRLLIDHMGMPDPVEVQSSGYDWTEMRILAQETSAIVKLSAPFRVSRKGFPYGDLSPVVRMFVSYFGVDRCIWGSDWPFLAVSVPVNYEDQIAWLGHWLPSQDDREKILWHNPARLFGFSGERR
jgi:predicted TIM-barrel fold metal-dependent hydrolase